MPRNIFRHKLMDEANPDGGDGGGATETPNIEEVMTQLAQLKTENEKLAKHNETLFSERKADQEKQRKAQEELQQRELEQSKAAGKLEEFETQLRGQYDEKLNKSNERIEQLNNMILGGEKDRMIAELAGGFLSPEVAKLMLGGLIKTEYGDGNSIAASFNGIDGQMVTTDFKAFKEYIANSDVFAPYLKGADSSGGMGGNSKPSGGAGGKNSMKRADFEQLGSHQQMKFIQSGGKVS